jgi:DNA-binding MurR/RpiR family transcriptional regulator
MDMGQSVLARMRTALPELRPSERRVVSYVLEHSAEVIHMSVLELSEATQSAQSTIIRCCRTLGLGGFQELKIHLARDTQSFASYAFDQMGDTDGEPAGDLHRVLGMSAQAVNDARSTVDAQAFDRAVDILDGASSILILAYGTSQMVAECATDQFISIGLEATAPRLSNLMYLQSHTVPLDSCALIISHSGATKALIQNAETLQHRGVPVIALTSFRRSSLAEAADVILATGSQELSFRFEYLSARLVHLAIVNSLYLALAKRNPERSRASLDLYYQADSAWRI